MIYKLLLVLIFSLQVDTNLGSVQGRVLNRDGQPVPKVKIYPIAENGGYMGTPPWARTDESGNFVLRGLIPGDNRLFVVDTESGFPDGRYGIFAGDPSLYSVVKIEGGQTIGGVVLTMPRKGAVFSVMLIDAETEQPVLSARIRVTRPDLPQAFLDSSPDLQGRFEIVLPELPFRVEIRAPNYEAWRYSELDSQGKEANDLLLHPGTRKDLAIKLARVKQQGQHK